MTDLAAREAFRPILYAKDTCPFCLKVDIFLLEAGLRDLFTVRAFALGDAQEAAIRSELAPHCLTASFPTVQLAPGAYLTDSDEIIAHYARKRGIEIARLTVFQSFLRGMLPRQIELYREVAALKAQLAG